MALARPHRIILQAMTLARQELLNCIRGSLWVESSQPLSSEDTLAEAREQAIVSLIAPVYAHPFRTG